MTRVIKTYLDLLPEEILIIIYKKVIYSILTSREFEIAHAWMSYRIARKRMAGRHYHYTSYIEHIL